MKIRGFVVLLFLVAFAFAPPKLNAQGTYSAKLISPTLGQVLYPGQVVTVQWKARLPHIDFGACEMEVFLSFDGGRTFPMRISPWMNARGRSFDWTVPNEPSNAAVMDIRFGCEPGWPESYAPQPASTFVIARAGEQ
jgi:hypothetical protein